MIRLAYGIVAGLLLVTGSCTEEKVQRPPDRVTVAPLAMEKVRSGPELTGTVQALRKVDLAFKVGGTVESIYQVWSPETARGDDATTWFPIRALTHTREAQAGDAAPRGAALATLDTRDLQYEVDLAQARIDRTAARIHRARSTITLAQIEAEVAKGLAGTEAAGPRDVEQAQARLNQALADLEVTLKDNAEAQLALQGAKERLGEAKLVAPLDNGTILRKSIHAGDTATAGRPAFTLIDLSTVRVTFAAPEATAFGDSPDCIAVGEQVAVVAAALPNRSFAGRVTLVAPVVDPATRTVACEATLDNAAGQLRPGMFATVRREQEKTAAVVPASAVQRGRDGATVVFVLEKDKSIVHERKVALAGVYGDRVAIKLDGESAVALGDLVVVSVPSRLEEGRAVKVVGQ